MPSSSHLVCFCFALFIVARPGSAIAAEPREAGFEVSRYAKGLHDPTAIEFDPDGRLFIAEKSGAVRIAIRGVIRKEPVVTIPVYEFFECGLIGMALDPDYATNSFLYVFATVAPDEQQIIRYRIVDGFGTDATVIRDHIPSGGTIHNGGCIRFGPDGMIYFSVGDNGRSENAQSDSTLAGKICRITRDGQTPTDNPFTSTTGAPSAIFAKGFRNPFRFCFDNTGRLFSIDVGSTGSARREEINHVQSGANFGWPIEEGIADDGAAASPFTPPAYAYSEEGQCAAGVVSYDGDHFPPEYRGNLFQLDYTLSKVFRMTLDGDQITSHTLFVQAEGSCVDLTKGPDGRLYYCEIVTGEVKRISFTSNATTEPGGTLDPDDFGGAKPDPTTGGGNDNQNGNDTGGGPIPAFCGAGAAFAPLLGIAMIVVARGKRRRRG